MSAVLALWNRTGEPANENVVRSMLALSFNPDSDGQDFWLGEDVALGHQHFWITPQEKGQPQPQVDPQSSCVVTCDARLDNRLELIHSLELVEADSNQLSDSDLILKAYNRWGTECVSYLLGDFIFALWDPAHRRMLAVRDSLGGKDLYYILNREILLMASSISMLLEHPAVQPRLNETKITEYLAVDWGDDVSTFYEGIVHLPPAHCLVVTPETSSLSRYWDVDPTNSIHYSHPEQYAEQYQELLKEALRCRLRSAYPVGISLSGGLDSSALTCLVVEVLPDAGLPQDTLGSYSYVFDELASCDERRFIDPVVESASRSFSIRPTMIVGDALWPAPLKEDWWIHRDYPFQDPYFYLLQAILQAGHKDGLRVMLNGFYGDDLYSGSEYLFADLMLQGRFRETAQILAHSGKKIHPKQDLLDNGLRAMIPSSVKSWYRSLRPTAPSWSGWIQPEMAARTGLGTLAKSSNTHPQFQLPGRQKRYTALFHTGYSERAKNFQDLAQLSGMEYQFPLMDRRIVEFVLALPPEQIALPGHSRRILRSAGKGKFPNIVQKRQGKSLLFDLYERGMITDCAPDIQNVFHHSQVVERGYVRENWLESELAGKSNTRGGFIFWLVLSLETWLQKYWR